MKKIIGQIINDLEKLIKEKGFLRYSDGQNDVVEKIIETMSKNNLDNDIEFLYILDKTKETIEKKLSKKYFRVTYEGLNGYEEDFITLKKYNNISEFQKDLQITN